MSLPLPASTLADRLAGLSGEVSLEAAEAWRLKRLWLEMLAKMLTMLAGLAAQFAAGTLPASQPQAARLGPVSPINLSVKAADAPRLGRARASVDCAHEEFLPMISGTGTSAPNRAAPATMRASGPATPSRGVGRLCLGFRLDWGEAGKTGVRTVAFSTPFLLLFRNK